MTNFFSKISPFSLRNASKEQIRAHNDKIISSNYSLASPIPIKVDTETIQKVYEKPVGILKRAGKSAAKAFESLKKLIEKKDLVPLITSIHSNATEAEVVFNVVACIPYLGGIGCAIRTVAGKVQIVAGGSVFAFAELALYLDTKKQKNFHPLSSSDARAKLALLSKFGREHVIHGCLNVLRGLSELALMGCTYGIGNVLLIAPNMMNRRDFKPFIPYGILTKVAAVSKSKSSSSNRM